MTRAIDDSKKESYLLIQFTITATGDVSRFTNWATTIDPGGENWVSTPTIDVTWPNNTGTLSANGCIIKAFTEENATMLALVDLLLGDGAPTPAVEVEIREVIRPVTIGDTATVLIPFRGRLLRAVRNAGGKSKRVRFEVQSIKSRLDIPLGLPCNHHCPWQFMGRGCSVQGGGGQRGPQLIVERRVRSVLAINGKEITVDSDPSLTGSKSFQFGFVERNGVRIGVQDWDPLDPTKLVLRQQPPAEWATPSAVTLVPGCDKTLLACQDDWDNEENFGGIGFAIPAYNPHFEDGS